VKRDERADKLCGALEKGDFPAFVDACGIAPHQRTQLLMAQALVGADERERAAMAIDLMMKVSFIGVACKAIGCKDLPDLMRWIDRNLP
jgi:hypothetical protein